ncbi:Serine/threonine-protein kinase [Ceratobasidium sp. AG-Ba]|nr:Serine/threonine-protein kinase [Ceratobasidium sp. AG-Ba]
MAQTDVRPSQLPPGHAFEYEQLEAYRALEHVLDQPIHFDQLQAAPYVSQIPSAAASTNQPAPFAQYTSLVGRTIASPSGNRFRLAFRRVLGVGAYGVVYLAEEIERQERRYGWLTSSAALATTRHEREQTISTAGRMYAVKVMRCAPRGSRQRTFQAREVALHKRADGHPGVVPLHAVYGTGTPPSANSPRKRKAWNPHSLAARVEDQLTWEKDAELSGEPLPILESGVREELVYMVLSYVGGGDLFTMIADRQRYIGQDALVTDVFLQLLDAVEWCHEQGVKHRDLKPENILCEADGRRVVISDFGLATTERSSRDFGCGSSYYMSPECYGDPLAPATVPNYDTLANDVWTLGVVLVNLTTGRNPWEAASPQDPTFKSFCADPSNFLMSILPITPQANEVFTRVFERDQTRRCSLAELRHLVLGVSRWTLRGAELDFASEGARDVARGCGLAELEPGNMLRRDTSSGSSSGSSDMGQRSRFSEDTIFDNEEPEVETQKQDPQAEMHWHEFVPPESCYGRADYVMSSRSESTCSHSSLEMARSRPVSKILSYSPPLAADESWGADGQFVILEPQPALQSFRPESIPRWPRMVQGWDQGEDFEGSTPRTPPPKSKPLHTEDTPRIIEEVGTPKVVGLRLGTPRDAILGTPQSNANLHTPKLSNVRLGSGPSSPFQSRIPRYTGPPRIQTDDMLSPSKFIGSPSPTYRKPTQNVGLGMTLEGFRCQLHPNVSCSTISVDSSESGLFPPTPMKAEVDLASPKVIVSRPSDARLREAPRSAAQSLWDGSCGSQTTLWSSEFHGRPALELEPGAAIYDASEGLLGEVRQERDRNKSWNAPIVPATTNPTPRRRYHTIGEGGYESQSLTSVRRRVGPRSPSQQRKIKRVPVPPIPSELLEEHQRQLSFKKHGRTLQADQMTELAPEANQGHGILPPPGLPLDPRDRQAGPKRLLENARAWFRRT